MAIQLIAMDLDGTLLSADHMTVSDRNREALRRASEKGVRLVLASGRTWVQLESVAQQVPSIQYALLSNGAAARDLQQGERLFTFDFPWEDFQTLLALLHRYDAVFETYCAGQSYLESRLTGRFQNKSLPAAFIERLIARLRIVDNLEETLAGQAIEKVNVFSMPEQNYEPLLAALRQTGRFEISSAIIGNMEVNAKGIDKGVGLKRLCAELGIAPENVMAFGDATNDLGMLCWAGWSFAMANAHESVKKAARYETASNEEDGVARAIDRYVL
jgi:hypothetical protein